MGFYRVRDELRYLRFLVISGEFLYRMDKLVKKILGPLPPEYERQETP